MSNGSRPRAGETGAGAARKPLRAARSWSEAAALFNQALAFHRAGLLQEAEQIYRRILESEPKHFDSLHLLGVLQYQRGDCASALRQIDLALQFNSHSAVAHNNRGTVLTEVGYLEEAVASYDRAIALDPNYVDACYGRGNVLKDLGRFAEALASYDRAIALKPNHVDAFQRRGYVLFKLIRYDEALASLDCAIALRSDCAEVFFNRGSVLLALKRPKDALENYDRAFALKPNTEFVLGSRVHVRALLCDWTDFDGECRRLLRSVSGGAAACYPFQLLACPAGARDQLVCAETFAEKYAAPALPLWRGERYGHERIRVAYLSSDFRDHPITHLTAGMFEHHDRSRFETLGIALRSDSQVFLRNRLNASFDRFVDAHAMHDEEIARLLHEQEVDIAVDLNGPTEGSRPHVFARKPTPLQVNYLGYAGTLGRSYCDYIIADRFVIPEHAQDCYSEKVVYLPDSFMPSDDKRAISENTPSREEAGLPERGFIFCCFNNSYKITPDVFDAWMRLLGAAEGSVLWLLAANDSVPDNLRREAEQRGVSAERLVFASKTLRNEDHLARLRLADVFLDTFYYNAHATANDALWAGVPVVTCAGETFASRVAGSLLHAVGLPELVTYSLSEYEALALKLARDPALLSALKHKLARQRGTHALFNTARFTRHIEAAYVTMWKRAERGEAPQSFAVEAIQAIDR